MPRTMDGQQHSGAERGLVQAASPALLAQLDCSLPWQSRSHRELRQAARLVGWGARRLQQGAGHTRFALCQRPGLPLLAAGWAGQQLSAGLPSVYSLLPGALPPTGPGQLAVGNWWSRGMRRGCLVERVGGQAARQALLSVLSLPRRSVSERRRLCWALWGERYWPCLSGFCWRTGHCTWKAAWVVLMAELAERPAGPAAL